MFECVVSEKAEAELDEMKCVDKLVFGGCRSSPDP